MTDRIEQIAEGLSDLELELFSGKADGWGSWMFSVGSDLVAKGLGRKEGGSIYFDTPLANQLRNHLQASSGHHPGS